MEDVEATIKEALDGLEQGDVPRELWPVVVAALVEARGLADHDRSSMEFE